MSAPIDWEALFAAASAAREKAYAPYSRFAVGAAGLFDSPEDGAPKVIAGCNVENASFGLSVCAERNAIGRAVLEGAPRLRALAVVVDTATPCPPCGACRQVIVEFAEREVPVHTRNLRGDERRYTVESLLPDAFDKDFL